MKISNTLDVVAPFMEPDKSGNYRLHLKCYENSKLKMKKIIIGIIGLYQKCVSPLKGRNCRFYPTCSQYGIEAIEKYGIWQGTLLTILRIFKCHPLNPGGYDPVPQPDD